MKDDRGELDLTRKIDELTETIEGYKVLVKMQKDELWKLKQASAKLDKANSYKNTLIDKLRKHDLAKLSMKKPGLVEKKINNGTKKLFRSLESLTGAPPPTPVVK